MGVIAFVNIFSLEEKKKQARNFKTLIIFRKKTTTLLFLETPKEILLHTVAFFCLNQENSKALCGLLSERYYL